MSFAPYCVRDIKKCVICAREDEVGFSDLLQKTLAFVAATIVDASSELSATKSQQANLPRPSVHVQQEKSRIRLSLQRYRAALTRLPTSLEFCADTIKAWRLTIDMQRGLPLRSFVFSAATRKSLWGCIGPPISKVAIKKKVLCMLSPILMETNDKNSILVLEIRGSRKVENNGETRGVWHEEMKANLLADDLVNQPCLEQGAFSTTHVVMPR